MVKFSIDFEDSQALMEAFKQVADRAEDLTNNYLSNRASTETMLSIVGLIPVSNRNKKHAQGSSPLTKKMINLGFEIKPKGPYRYLVFPNDGIGSKNKVAQQFFEKGLEKVEPQIIKELTDILVKAAELN